METQYAEVVFDDSGTAIGALWKCIMTDEYRVKTFKGPLTDSVQGTREHAIERIVQLMNTAGESFRWTAV